MIDLLADEGDLQPLSSRRHGRREYRLTRDLLFRDVRVPAGFVTDKYSLPGRLIPALWQPQHAKFATPAVIHDWLFETMLKTFEASNIIFLEAMKAAGVKAHHRCAAYRAVSLFGRSGYGLVDPDNVPLVRTVRPDIQGLLSEPPHGLFTRHP